MSYRFVTEYGFVLDYRIVIVYRFVTSNGFVVSYRFVTHYRIVTESVVHPYGRLSVIMNRLKITKEGKDAREGICFKGSRRNRSGL